MNRQSRRAAAKQARAPKGADLVEEGRRHHRGLRLDLAKTLYIRALAAQPNNTDALHLLGVLNHQQGNSSNALTLINQALAIKPEWPEAYTNLGLALAALGRLDEAIAAYRQAIAVKRNYAEAHHNLGVALAALGKLDEAIAAYHEAIAIKGDYSDAHHNLGNALNRLGRPSEAHTCFTRAIAMQPSYPGNHNGLGLSLYMLGRFTEAEASYREALRYRPNFPDAHCSLAQQFLLTGRFHEGWEEYEWRWKIKQMSPALRGFSAPMWNGEAIEDRIILLHAEQGLGDTLQFCRYVPLVASRATTILEVQRPLIRLLSRLPGITQIVAHGDSLPVFDVQCPLLSLPRAFATTLDTIPRAISYLSADPALSSHWRVRLAGLDGLKVGLVWAGEQRLGWANLVAMDRRRSIALATMAPLGGASGVSFISLQKGEPAAQASIPPPGMVVHDFTSDLHDFEDTAALIANLDLVISVDTAVAHLAGALGKPVWLLNRFDTDWRWLLNRDDSPWYPSLRQFRQPSLGDWGNVIAFVRDALLRLATGDRDQLRARSDRVYK